MAVKYCQLAGLALMVTAVQLIAGATGNAHVLTQLTMTAYYSILVIGLCMLIGYAGQISMGHAGFFSIGGYLSAILTTFDFSRFKDQSLVALFRKSGLMLQRTDIYGGDHLVFHPWTACLAAVGAALVVAYLVGGPVLRLKGHYLAMATLGFGTIIYRIVLGTATLGAADGITDVPPLPLLPGVEITGNAAGRIVNYYLSWAMVALGMLLLINLVNSRAGRALSAIHGAEDAADSMGIPTTKYKVRVFVLSAVFAALAGVMMTHYNGGIGPSEASIMKSVRYVAIVAIGGMSNLWGALSMSLILNYLSLRGTFGTYDDAVFGVILIVIMLFAPEGIIRKQLLNDLRSMFRRVS